MPYNTVETANTYFNTYRLDAPYWGQLDATKQLVALNEAHLRIELLCYRGSKTDVAQTTEFPREGDLVVPDVILYAECEIAYALAEGRDIDADFENLLVSTHKYGPVSDTNISELNPANLSGIPSHRAWMFLKSWLSDPGSITLYRA